MAAFIAGAFVASPELRAYAANTIGSADIINESILSVDIKNGEVKNSDLATSAVSNSKIATSAVSNSKLASNAVTSSKILDGTVGLADMSSNSVDSSKIVDASVQAVDLGNGTVTNAKIAADAVKGDKIADGTITYPDVSKAFIAVEHREDCDCGGTGWDPNGVTYNTDIYDDRITATSVVSVSWNTIYVVPHCETRVYSGLAWVFCDSPIGQGVAISYAIFNNPAYG